MQIAVIGGTGKAGSVFVDTALTHGHQIKLLVRSTSISKLKPSTRLIYVIGDALEKPALADLVTDCDAVVSFLGHTSNSPVDLQEQVMDTLIPIMKNMRVDRLISITGYGVPFPGDQNVLWHTLINTGVSFFDPDRVTDGIAHANQIIKSNLDWTIIRTPVHTSATFGLPTRVDDCVHWKTGFFVSREKIAVTTLQCLVNQEYIRQAPVVSQSVFGE